MKASARPGGSAQLGLFQPSGPALSFARPRVLGLAPGSWVEHHQGWLHAHAELFAELEQLPAWERRTRWMYTRRVDEPRLTAEYASLAGAPASVSELASALSAHYGVSYDSAWMNLYRDHQDSTGWHVDRPYSKRESCTVPVLSLGETRRFLIRAREGGPSTRIVVEAGDLVVMGGRCQRDFVHCVPKEIGACGMRISINFGSSAQAGEE